MRNTRTTGMGAANERGGSSSTTELLMVQQRRDLQNRTKGQELTRLELSTLISSTGSKGRNRNKFFSLTCQ